MSLFAKKNLLITGGTGSFGNAVLSRFLATEIGEIRVFSRDEKKQDDMRHEFQRKMPEAGVRSVPVHGQGGLSRQCHGCIQGLDEKGGGGRVVCAGP